MRIPSWLTRRRLDLDEDDFKDEIQAHLAIAQGERMADGADPRNARAAALKEFGNVTLTTEAARRVWMPGWLERLRDQINDVRYAIRALAKNPVFSVTVVGVLALGIGLNAAVFTMLKGFALSPIAGVDGSARLAVIFGETGAGREVRISYPDYRHLRDHHRAFADLFGTALAKVNLGRGRHARQIWGELVSGNYFRALGVDAALGRTLLPADELAPGAHPVVVIGDGLWRRDFAADPDIVGKTIELNQYPLTVVGVADPAFHGTTVVYDVEVYVPVTMTAELGFRFGSDHTSSAAMLADHRVGIFHPSGFLRQDASIARAAAQSGAIWTALSRDRSHAEAAERLRVVRFWQTPNGAPSYILPTLGVLSAMGLLVLTIACANIAGLVLVRGVSRRGEIAVRLALGASRMRIVRLLILENLVLAVPGALLGVLLARWGIPVLVGYAERLAAPQRLFFNAGVDDLVVAFAAIVACGSAIVFGFVPALRSARVDLVSVINEDASPRGASRGRLRTGLVVAQVAVSLLLLVGAGLAIRTVEAARHADLGFDGNHVTALVLDVKQNGYDEPRGRLFYRQLLEAVRADPAVESVTLATNIPIAMLDSRPQPVAIQGYEAHRDEDLMFMSNVVGSDYFQTLRIALLAGREFEDRDDESGEPVAVVNHTFAQRFLGGSVNAVGKRIRVGEGGEWRTVVGVAADVKYSRINEGPRPYIYLPFLQSYRAGMYVHARAATRAAGDERSTASAAAAAIGTEDRAAIDQLVERLRQHVAAVDADLPILSARAMSSQIRGALIFYDLMATMLFVFGAAGMTLAAMGTYGLVSYAVKQRTREIGIRMALGATAASVVRGFLGSGLRLGAIGIGVGLVAALAVTQLLRNVLFGVSATDAASFGAALAVVLSGVVLATIVPAWRASRTNALAALRHQ